MVVKQKNLRVFEIEIDSEVEFFDYVNKNSIILQRFLLLLKGNITNNIIIFLNDNGMPFFDINNIKDTKGIFSNGKTKSVEIKEHKKESKKSQDSEDKEAKSRKLIFNRTIRSGEEIISDEDIIIFGRVNSGAKIITTANVEIFGRIDGLVECGGEYLIAKKIGNGDVFFNGEVIEKSIFNGTIKQITLKNSSLTIKEL